MVESRRVKRPSTACLNHALSADKCTVLKREKLFLVHISWWPSRCLKGGVFLIGKLFGRHRHTEKICQRICQQEVTDETFTRWFSQPYRIAVLMVWAVPFCQLWWLPKLINHSLESFSLSTQQEPSNRKATGYQGILLGRETYLIVSGLTEDSMNLHFLVSLRTL